MCEIYGFHLVYRACENAFEEYPALADMFFDAECLLEFVFC